MENPPKVINAHEIVLFMARDRLDVESSRQPLVTSTRPEIKIFGKGAEKNLKLKMASITTVKKAMKPPTRRMDIIELYIRSESEALLGILDERE